jgi:hypothetical protein
MGRLTGSASVDTLVRVGLEKQHGLTPESRMTVLDDFQVITHTHTHARTHERTHAYTHARTRARAHTHTHRAIVDTLVRVGLEKQHGLTPESRMTVLDDFQVI